jgi:glycosyltransferase involved in cell wall biosynthesis
VGWQFAKAVSKHHNLWIITEKEKFQAEIEQELDRRPLLREHMQFYYIQKRRGRRLRKVWPPSYYWFYRQWQWQDYQLARSLHERIGFDLVHQLNMVGFREPGYLWRLPLPFVWGPVGGMVQFPWKLLACAGLVQGMRQLGHNVANALHMRLLHRPRIAGRRAQGGLIAATSEIRAKMLRLWGAPSQVICEVGQASQVAEGPSLRRPGEPLRLAWCGWHMPRKGLPLLFEALARLNDSVNWRLDIIGDGPCSMAWKRQAARLGLSENCRWHGAVSREKAISIVHDAHLFVITSLKDLTSTVLLEAISQAAPVLCLDHCGFADVVGPGCGVKIPLSGPGRVSAAMAEAVEMLWNDEDRRRRLAEGALRRSWDFSWDLKAEMLNDIYQRAISEYARRSHESLHSS